MIKAVKGRGMTAGNLGILKSTTIGGDRHSGIYDRHITPILEAVAEAVAEAEAVAVAEAG